MQEPWKTDKWFISPWSYLPEVTKNYAFPPDVRIHDVTLRDGEQQTAVVFRREEKVAIAKQLDALGIHRIEAGMPAVSAQDKAAISDIAALGLKADIFGFARCIPGGDRCDQGVRLQGGRRRDPGQRSHDQERLRVDRRSRDEVVDRYDARGQGGRPVHRLLHDRRHSHRAQSLPRHRRAGGHRGPHGRADDCRHDGWLHAGRRLSRRGQGDRPLEEACGDPLSPGLRPRRGQHRLPRWPPEPRWRTPPSPVWASEPATSPWKTW